MLTRGGSEKTIAGRVEEWQKKYRQTIQSEHIRGADEERQANMRSRLFFRGFKRKGRSEAQKSTEREAHRESGIRRVRLPSIDRRLARNYSFNRKEMNQDTAV